MRTWPFFPYLMHISVTAAAAPQISQLVANVITPGVLMLRVKVHSSGPVYHALASFGRVKAGGLSVDHGRESHCLPLLYHLGSKMTPGRLLAA